MVGSGETIRQPALEAVVGPIDVVHRRPLAAHADHGSGAALLRDALSMDEARWDIDEVAGLDVNDLVAVLEHHAPIGDVAVGGVVTVVVPAGRRAPGKLREAGPHPVVRERLP